MTIVVDLGCKATNKHKNLPADDSHEIPILISTNSSNISQKLSPADVMVLALWVMLWVGSTCISDMTN